MKTGKPSPDQLKEAIREVLQNPSYRQKARIIQTDFVRHDSPTEAAQLLEQLAQTKQPLARLETVLDVVDHQ